MRLEAMVSRVPEAVKARRQVTAAIGAGLLLMAALAAGSVWDVATTISPRTTAGDLLGLAWPPPPTAGGLDWKLVNGRRVNLLLLGYGGAGQDNPKFTDTVVVLSLNASERKVVIVSLPRF